MVPKRKGLFATLKGIQSSLYYTLTGPLRKRVMEEVSRTYSMRFLQKFSDPDEVRLIVQSQRYRDLVRPAERDGPDEDRILVLAPHQDDDTLGLGGTLIRCLRAGKRVKVAYVTNGAAGTKPTNSKELAEVRNREARAVWDNLGGEEPLFLDMPCRNIELTPENAARIRTLVDTEQAGCLMIPFLLEAPDDHRSINRLLLMAHEQSPFPDDLSLWAYQVTSMICPNTIVDITEVRDEKNRINRMWASQMTSFDLAHMADGLSAYNSQFLSRRKAPTGPRYAEAFFTVGIGDYIEVLKTYFREGR